MKQGRTSIAGLGTQRGQSTVEFVVLAAVLVPLFLIVPLIGKYIDLMQTTEQASRYVAFEAMARNTRSTWKTDAELGVEVRRRFFSSTDAPVKTNDAAGDYWSDRNPLWSDHTGQPMLDEFAYDVVVNTTVSNKDAIPATVAYRDELNLSDDNFYTAAISVYPGNVADANLDPFDGLGLEITRRTVILADAWTGFSPADIRGRVEGSFWMYPIEPAKTLINDTLGQVPALIFDPPLKVGEFDWDVVPCDRLIGGC
jgi:hypothetical protein